GPGSAAATRCAAQLAWNGQAFGEGVSVSDAAGAAGSAAPPPAAPPPPASAAAPARLTVSAGAEAEFLARCRRDYVSQDAGAARWADGQCKAAWRGVVAAGPAAEGLLAGAPAPGEALSLAAGRQRATGVRWAAGAAAPFIAVGALGGLSASVDGRGA